MTSNQTATVTASYTSGGVTRTATRSVTIVNARASAASSVNEVGTGTYTATATWSDGTATSVTPSWSENSTYATISTGGVLTTSAVTSNQAVTVTASYASGGVTRTATRSVTIANVTATLTGIAVSGPTSVNEGGTGTYTAMGTWDNGTTAAISPTWSVSASYATIGVAGALTASTVTADQTVTVTASYGGRTGTMSVTIVDAPGTVPAEAKNIGITGPIPSGRTQVWRLTWDPVTTYANDVPLEAGRTVQYMAYWTDDPALSDASLKQLSSAVSASALDFDPTGRMMPKNQKTYLTVRAILDTGEVSRFRPLSFGSRQTMGPRHRQEDPSRRRTCDMMALLRFDDINRRDRSYGSRPVTMKKAAKYLLWIGILSALALPAFAETRTISWDPVTTYTDGTRIEAGKTVSYTSYWTMDPGLGSLTSIATSITATSTTFDPGVQGMARAGPVHFTAKAVLNTGEESALSSHTPGSFPWSSVPGCAEQDGLNGPVSSGGTQGGASRGTRSPRIRMPRSHPDAPSNTWRTGPMTRRFPPRP